MTDLALRCDQPDCPLLRDGHCLEAFEDPEDCPHASALNSASADERHLDEGDFLDEGDLDEELEELGSDESTTARVQMSTPQHVLIEGHEALTLAEAGRLTAKRKTRVVLLAGEVESGKTTLLVETYAQFLASPLGKWWFGGSRSIGGFHRRHKPARASSGAIAPTTERTTDDDLRHLHLSVADGDQRVDLLLSDLPGEIFENLIDGASAVDELPFIRRVDVCLVIVDGALMVTPSGRSLSSLRARQLIGSLISPEALRRDARLVIVCTKNDLIDDAQRSAVTEVLASLAEWCLSRCGEMPIQLMVSARPSSGATPDGLESLLDLVCAADDPTVSPSLEVSEGRYFWRGGSSDDR